MNLHYPHLIDFYKDYSKAMDLDSAALFAGAGLSISSGGVNWRELLEPLANEIGLNLDYESDLVMVAQYIKNKGDEGELYRYIQDKLRGKKPNKYHEKIVALPIKSIWTTNFDDLIEKSFEDIGETTSIPVVQNFIVETNKNDTIIYKIHGNSKDKVVITRDDFESYKIDHEQFYNELQKQWITKTFLFIGYSFNDPNLKLLISELKERKRNKKPHYFFFLEPEKPVTKGLKKVDEASRLRYESQQIRSELFCKDMLKNYNLYPIKVQDSKEIEQILNELNRIYFVRKLYINGTPANADFTKMELPPKRLEQDIFQFCFKLGKNVAKNGMKLAIRLNKGLGIETAIIGGYIESPMDSFKSKKHGDNIEILNSNMKWSRSSNIAIYLFGDIKDFEEEKKYISDSNSIVIPFRGTGFLAQKIYDWVKENGNAETKEIIEANPFLETFNGESKGSTKVFSALDEIFKNYTKV